MKKLKQLGHIILLAIILASASSGVFLKTANATTPYDNLIQPVSSLELKDFRGNSSYDRNFTVNWLSAASSLADVKQGNGTWGTALKQVIDHVKSLDPNLSTGDLGYGNWGVLYEPFEWNNEDIGAFRIIYGNSNLTGLKFRQISTSGDYQLVGYNGPGGDFTDSTLGFTGLFYIDSNQYNATTNPYALTYDGNYPSFYDRDRSTPPPNYDANPVLASVNASRIVRPLLWTFPLSYPTGYAGETVFDVSSVDLDDDGLTGAQEATQGTSDSEEDTDKDGLSDLVESITYNAYYGLMFCKQTSPYTCATPNPLEKDLLVEIDWMDNGVDPPYRPSPTQLGLVQAMLESEGINVFFDIGEYGGGNELDVYAADVNWYETPGELDIHDYKYGATPVATGLSTTLDAQFDSTYREGVWRYMIYGVSQVDDLGTGIMGAAEIGMDDAIIAVKNSNFQGGAYSLDRAVAGLVGHEIGHLLCLSSSNPYIEQDPDCVHPGIDNNSESNYLSIMNYDYDFPRVFQLSTMNYSDGTHGMGDHNDWGAIKDGGMGLFIYSSLYDATDALSTAKAPDNKRISKDRSDAMLEIKSTAQDKVKNNLKILKLKQESKDKTKEKLIRSGRDVIR